MFQKTFQLIIIRGLDFSVDYGSTDVDNILDVHKYLMKKHNIG